MITLIRIFLFLFCIINFIEGDKLSACENERLQKICGIVNEPEFGKLVNNTLQRKSHGGTELWKYALGWVVYVGGRVRAEGGFTVCSGTQISSRHVLTAAHCLYEDQLPYHSNSKSERPVMSTEFRIRTGSSCIDGITCAEDGERFYKAAKIYVMDEFDITNHAYTDIAVIELDREIPENEGTPMCIPFDGNQDLSLNSESKPTRTNLQKFLFGAGYGHDRTKPNVFTILQFFRMEPVFEHYGIIIKGVNSSIKAHGLEMGDSGSGSIQYNNRDGRLEIVGVLSRGDLFNIDKESVEKDELDILTDVRYFTSWICAHAGICSGIKREDINHDTLLPTTVYNFTT